MPFDFAKRITPDRAIKLALFAALAFGGCAGCGSSGAPASVTTLVPVKGKVTLKGEPLTTGTIRFEPDDFGRTGLRQAPVRRNVCPHHQQGWRWRCPGPSSRFDHQLGPQVQGRGHSQEAVGRHNGKARGRSLRRQDGDQLRHSLTSPQPVATLPPRYRPTTHSYLPIFLCIIERHRHEQSMEDFASRGSCCLCSRPVAPVGPGARASSRIGERAPTPLGRRQG